MPDPATLPDIVKPRRRWRWLRWLGLALVGLAASLAGKAIYNHHRVSLALEEALAELDAADPGWRLADIEAAREKVPEAENSARVVVAAAKLLPENWLPDELDHGLKKLPPEAQLSPEQYRELRQLLDRLRPALDAAARLPDLPRGRHRIEYQRDPMNTILNDQQRVRGIGTLFRLDATRHAHDRDPALALRSCLGAVNAGRSIGDEPFAVSQLVRIACVVLPCQAIERVLAQTEPSADELRRVQVALQAEDRDDDMLVIARGERAVLHELFDALESGDTIFNEFSGGPTSPSWQERLYGFAMRDRLRGEHPLLLRLMTEQVERAGLPFHEQIAPEGIFVAEVRALPRWSLCRIMVPPLSKVAEASRRKHACVRAMAALLATERYRIERGTWPEALEQLVPDFLSAVPLDPADGEPLRYRRLPDGVVVYGLGQDGKDDGGNVHCENPTLPGCDLGYQLWDPGKRRQPPRPIPKEDEE
jgi:hypothetical protein